MVYVVFVSNLQESDPITYICMYISISISLSFNAFSFLFFFLFKFYFLSFYWKKLVEPDEEEEAGADVKSPQALDEAAAGAFARERLPGGGGNNPPLEENMTPVPERGALAVVVWAGLPATVGLAFSSTWMV